MKQRKPTQLVTVITFFVYLCEKYVKHDGTTPQLYKSGTHVPSGQKLITYEVKIFDVHCFIVVVYSMGLTFFNQFYEDHVTRRELGLDKTKEAVFYFHPRGSLKSNVSYRGRCFCLFSTESHMVIHGKKKVRTIIEDQIVLIVCNVSY